MLWTIFWTQLIPLGPVFWGASGLIGSCDAGPYLFRAEGYGKCSGRFDISCWNFSIVLWGIRAWRYIHIVSVCLCCNYTSVWCCSITPLSILQIFHSVFQCVNKVVCVCFVYVFHTKIIYNKVKRNWSCDVLPQLWGLRDFKISMWGKVLFYSFVRECACLWETVYE